jgi:predicted RND superfamily exporter protein
MHRRTSNLYYGASVVSGFAALLVAKGGASALAGIALALACCLALAALPRLFEVSDRATRRY